MLLYASTRDLLAVVRVLYTDILGCTHLMSVGTWGCSWGLQGKINGMGQYDGETARECGPRQDSGCVSAARWPVLAK
jgi:hypothetical protein